MALSALLLSCILITGGDSTAVNSPQNDLRGLVVIIDPGHGGTDSGTRRRTAAGWVNESQLTLGVALHLRTLVSELGGEPKLTVIVANPLMTDTLGAAVIPSHGADYYRLWGQPLITKQNLSERLRIAQQVLAEKPARQVVYLSLHFDHVRTRRYRAPITGVRLIYPENQAESAFIRSLAGAFQADSLLRLDDDRPLVSNGHRPSGVKRLLVLRGSGDPKRVRSGRRQELVYNPIEHRVLIELANLPSDQDWLRLQRSGSLRRYAQVIVTGLQDWWNQQRSSAAP